MFFTGSTDKPFRHTTLLYWLFAGLLLIGITVGQDYLQSVLRHTGFYWSEVLLYKLFWLLFLPLGYLMYSAWSWYPRQRLSLMATVVLATGLSLLAAGLHIGLFALLLSWLARQYFQLPFAPAGIVQEVMAGDAYLCLLIYGGLTGGGLWRRRSPSAEVTAPPPPEPVLHLRHGRQHIAIPLDTIRWIGTDAPYAVVHTSRGKHLYRSSLKQLARQLPPGLFVRIHRSAIVNRAAVEGLTSRLNGDYDLRLRDGTVLRLSRHFPEAIGLLTRPSAQEHG